MIGTLSCSTEENEYSSNQELLIGKWKRFKYGKICSSGSENVNEYSVCQQKGTITFKEDGTYIDEPYIFYNNVCETDGIYKGKWEIIDGNLYITNENMTPEKVDYFKISINFLTIGSSSSPCDNETSNSINYREFIRME